MRRRTHWVMLILCLAVMMGCAPPPGEGRKAREGYELSEPIIEALTWYREDQGEYPASLDDLVPDYLDAIPAGSLIQEFRYTQADETYQLSFSYVGPCMNYCDYTPEEGWDCGGFC